MSEQTTGSDGPPGPGTGYRDFVMPPPVDRHSQEWLDTPQEQRTVAAPRASATVVLLRDPQGPPGQGPPQVFVLRRVLGMPFAPGMIAFPGGGVDPRDADPALPWAGPSPQRWAGRLGTDEATARELVCAAARELFEECGVLIAGPGPAELVADLTDPQWRRERDALLDRSQGFAELLTRRGLVLRTDLLSLRAHWTTPVCEPRRYDTRFFAARLPRGQRADDATTEADCARWDDPVSLLAAQAAGQEILLPPTQVMVEQLVQVRDVDAWLAQDVPVHRVQPWPAWRDGRLWMRSPVGPDGHGLPGSSAPRGLG